MGRNARLKRERRARRLRPTEARLGWDDHGDGMTLTLDNMPKGGLGLLKEMVPQLRQLTTATVMDRSSCIGSTKLLVSLARAMGLHAVEQSVAGYIYNPVVSRWIERNGRRPKRAEQLQLAEDGGHLMTVAYPGDVEMPGHWGGHLVAVVEHTTLIDLTFDQFDRPARQIPVAGPMVQDWEPGVGVSLQRDDGVVVIWTPREGEGALGYKAAPDWLRTYKVVLNGVAK